MDMRTRLQQLMDKEGISPARFAEIVGVQRSSVSHILSGRNNPSLEFIQKILTAFPKISSDWLIIGSGAMYRGAINKQPGIAEPQSAQSAHTELFSGLKEEDPAPYTPKPKEPVNKPVPPSSDNMPEIVPDADPSPVGTPSFPGAKKMEQIVVFYNDGTFKVYLPQTPSRG